METIVKIPGKGQPIIYSYRIFIYFPVMEILSKRTVFTKFWVFRPKLHGNFVFFLHFQFMHGNVAWKGLETLPVTGSCVDVSWNFETLTKESL